MQYQPFLLSVGTDRTLLDLRTSVLRQAGYSVERATTADEAYRLIASQDFDVVILCHSLPEKDRQRLILSINAAKPRTRVMVVDSSAYRAKSELADDSMYNLDGPEQLLAHVARMLGQASAQHHDPPTSH